MFKKIIIYFLIISVIAPIFSALPFFASGNNVLAADKTKTSTSYKNKQGYTVEKETTTYSNGKIEVYERYFDKNDDPYTRKTTYKNSSDTKPSQKEITGKGGGDYTEASESSGTGGTGASTTGGTSGGDTGSAGSGSGSGSNSQEVKKTETKQVKSPCGRFSWFTSSCMGYLFAQAMYKTVFQLSYYVAAMAGSLFNTAISFSLNEDTYNVGADDEKDSLIIAGWKMVRDLINLVFIFILLYIAISTIIQQGSFGKDAIVKIIVAAVLINFSFMMTKMIIDASHIFAFEFYNKIDVENKDSHVKIKDEIKIKGIETKNIASVFMAGFNPQKLIIPSSGTENVEGLMSEMKSSGAGVSASWFQILLIMIMASVLNLLAAFIMFAGAIMFVMRVVVLWFLLIFSPVAFLGMMLPNLKSYSGQWWDKLIQNAIFAPGFLFPFMLVTKLINSGFLEKVVSASNKSATAKVLFLDVGSTIIVFFHFIIIGGLMVGCMIIANKMGAVGAKTTTKWGNKATDWARNTIGDRAALYYGKRGFGYGAQRLLQGQVQRDEKGKVRVDENNKPILTGLGKTMSWIPGLNRGIANISAIRLKQMKDEQKKVAKEISGYSDEGFAVVSAGGKFNIPTYTGQKAVEEVQKKKSVEAEKKKKIDQEKEELKALKSVEADATIFKDKFNKEIEKLEESLDGLDTDLDTANYKFKKAIDNKEDTRLIESTIFYTKQEILKKKAEKKIKEEKIKKIEKQEVRRKELEDKEERRKETEGLQEAVKFGGGTGGGGGGSKKP